MKTRQQFLEHIDTAKGRVSPRNPGDIHFSMTLRAALSCFSSMEEAQTILFGLLEDGTLALGYETEDGAQAVSYLAAAVIELANPGSVKLVDMRISRLLEAN